MERLLCEQLDYNLVFRWFVGLSMDDAVWDHSTLSKIRDRLMQSNVAQAALAATRIGIFAVSGARTRPMSSEAV